MILDLGEIFQRKFSITFLPFLLQVLTITGSSLLLGIVYQIWLKFILGFCYWSILLLPIVSHRCCQCTIFFCSHDLKKPSVKICWVGFQFICLVGTRGTIFSFLITLRTNSFIFIMLLATCLFLVFHFFPGTSRNLLKYPFACIGLVRFNSSRAIVLLFIPSFLMQFTKFL